MQAVLSDIPEFSPWYESQRLRLKSDELSKIMVTLRNRSQHEGAPGIMGGSAYRSPDGVQIINYYASSDDDAPSVDVLPSCERYMRTLCEIVADCYREFGPAIDPSQHYTLDNLAKIGKTIEDVEEELGFPRGWTHVPGASDYERLTALRRHILRASIHNVIAKYINGADGGTLTCET